MAIKGWSDRRRVPRLGTIGIGYKDESGNPRWVDYFVVPPEVQAIYGERPKELDIMIPSEDPEIYFPEYLKRYGANMGLICRGDGETASLNGLYARQNGAEYGLDVKDGQIISLQTGEVMPVTQGGDDNAWVQIPCRYRQCPLYIAGKCREVGILSVILPKVPGVLGVYSIDTGSYRSSQNIRGALDMLQMMFGRVSLIPLKLKVRLEQANPVIQGERQIKTMVPAMYIEMAWTMEKALEMAQERRLLGAVNLPKESHAIVEVEPVDVLSLPAGQEQANPPNESPQGKKGAEETPQAASPVVAPPSPAAERVVKVSKATLKALSAPKAFEKAAGDSTISTVSFKVAWEERRLKTTVWSAPEAEESVRQSLLKVLPGQVFVVAGEYRPGKNILIAKEIIEVLPVPIGESAIAGG